MEKTYIVIAAYNEENNIRSVIVGLKDEGYKNIIVVDDGSKDKTNEISKTEGVIALKHMINCGQGAALQTGMSYALLDGADYIVHFDADGQHNPKEIKYMLEPIMNKEVDATLGSRFIKKQKIPFSRKIMLKGGILAILLFYGVKLSDAHNGFRAFSREGAKKIAIKSDRMEHASKIIKNGRKGQGSFDSIKILLKMLLKKIGA
jgi:glycosyltransferase involved in cell wall biosynthesis